MEKTLDHIRTSLREELSEWLGFDIPSVGDEDYEIWKSRAQEIEGISSIEEVFDYLSGLGRSDDAIYEFLNGFKAE